MLITRKTALLGVAMVISQVIQRGGADETGAALSVAPPNPSEAGDRFSLGGDVAIAFRWCPPGTLPVGSPLMEEGRDPDETRREERVEKGFWVGEHEVTQHLWTQVMGSDPWNDKQHASESPSGPATFVSHEDAKEFCAAFTKKQHGLGRLPSNWKFRLPTEVEWEYMCRAGSEAAFCYGDDRSRLATYAWFGLLDSEDVSHALELAPQPVGAKKPNAWGVHDVHGNVFEWCEDWYYEDADRKASTYTKDRPPVFRVIRGGGWDSSASKCRCAFRGWAHPEDKFDNIGFRLVLSGVGE